MPWQAKEKKRRKKNERKSRTRAVVVVSMKEVCVVDIRGSCASFEFCQVQNRTTTTTQRISSLRGKNNRICIDGNETIKD
jgi:hypothetical protein